MNSTSTKNSECKKDRRFISKNGKTYSVYAEDGCFYDMATNTPIFGMFGAKSIRDDGPFGPMRMMKIANVAKWL